MKLRHKIAGTFVLPLALAIASTAATAAVVVDNDKHTLKIGGFVGAQAGWTIKDKAAGQDSDVDFGMGLGTSRLNIAYTKKTSAGDITVLYENDWAGAPVANGGNYRLRHAVIKYDGWSAGYTWSGFANLTGLAETIDAVGTSGVSAIAPRTASLGKDIKFADGMSVGVFIEDTKHPFNTSNSGRGASANSTVAGKMVETSPGSGVYEMSYEDKPGRENTNTPMPDIVVNFKGDFGVAQTFAAVRVVQRDDLTTGVTYKPTATPDEFTKVVNGDAKTKAKVDFTVGVNSQVMEALNLKLAVTSFDKGVIKSPDGRDLAASVAGQYKITDKIRTNLVVEQFVADAKDSDYTAVWVNGFYKMDSGFEWGAELRSVSADKASKGTNGLGDKDMSFNLQAKYAF